MSITDQFLQYAEEAILTASYDRSGKPPSDDSPKCIGDSGSRLFDGGGMRRLSNKRGRCDEGPALQHRNENASGRY
jgi:hypothetical protein